MLATKMTIYLVVEAEAANASRQTSIFKESPHKLVEMKMKLILSSLLLRLNYKWQPLWKIVQLSMECDASFEYSTSGESGAITGQLSWTTTIKTCAHGNILLRSNFLVFYYITSVMFMLNDFAVADRQLEY